MKRTARSTETLFGVLILAALLALLLNALCSCAAPDDLSLGYGREFAGDSNLHGWRIDNDDSDFATLALTWHLKPQRVEVVNADVPPVRWDLRPRIVMPEPEAPVPEKPAEPPAGQVDKVRDAVATFDALNWWTQICLVVALGVIGWVYRKQLARLIPGRKAK